MSGDFRALRAMVFGDILTSVIVQLSHQCGMVALLPVAYRDPSIIILASYNSCVCVCVRGGGSDASHSKTQGAIFTLSTTQITCPCFHEGVSQLRQTSASCHVPRVKVTTVTVYRHQATRLWCGPHRTPTYQYHYQIFIMFGRSHQLGTPVSYVAALIIVRYQSWGSVRDIAWLLTRTLRNQPKKIKLSLYHWKISWSA